MNPVLMTALISGGINALQGKRGSDLLKSTVRDAAIAYALGPADPTQDTSGISQLVDTGTATQSMKDFPKSEGGLGPDKLSILDKLEKGFEKVEKPFMKDGKLSRFRLGLGAAGLTGAAYAAGMFDPKDPQKPRYPGYNRFYAANPDMFNPLSGNYGPDYSLYPEGAPYSGMQEGGIADATMMSPDDEMLQYDMEQQKTDDGPGIVGNLMKRFQESISDPEKVAMKATMRRPSQKVSEKVVATEEVSPQLPERIKREFVMKFKQDPDKTAIEYATTMRDKDRLTITDVQRAKDALEKLTNETEMDISDIEGLMGLSQSQDPLNLGGNIRIPKAPEPPAQVSDLMETMRSRATNEPRMQEFNEGDIVDVLPSKLKRDENDTSNYKRTSGKMVVDETGKGSGNKDTMLAQLADGEFVTKAKSVLGAGKAMGGKNKKEQRELGARFFYKQMADLEKLAESA